MARTQKKEPAPSFETVWAILQESAKRHEEFERMMKESKAEAEKRQAEFERMMKESKAEYEKRQAEYEKQNERSKKEFNERLGNFTNLFGDFTEAMVAPALSDKLQDFGFNFKRINRNISIKDDENKPLMEIDILLEDDEKAMLVEIKTRLTTEKIKHHIKRLEKMRVYANRQGDKRVFLGGVAGVIMTDKVREYALKQGFYLIEPAGETFNITPPAGKPKEW